MTGTVCIDSSFILAWLLEQENGKSVKRLMLEWAVDGLQTVGPPLLPAEVSSVLRNQVYIKRIPSSLGNDLFHVFIDMDITIIHDAALYETAWQIARKYNLPRTYDAQYLAAAEIYDCDLWTLDTRFLNSFQGKEKRVKTLTKPG
ncbi:MAG: hypothetical protein A2Z02_03775 [Chloroflexi bacterium RBG_16_48_7]|nr:MAG: hypothetical protein A2Z02_03775 [Chloroflexi bacterium RBG_16_48_7]